MPDRHVNPFIHCGYGKGFVTLLSMTENEFARWVDDLVDRHFQGRFQLLATGVGLTFSAFKRSVRSGSTSIETLLRICLATGESPDTVFAVAGKHEVHGLITQLYGPAAHPSLSARAREVALLFDGLQDEGAKAFFVDSLTGLVTAAQRRERNGDTLIANKTATPDKARRRGSRS